MESTTADTSAEHPADVIAKIDQKAIRLSALLRDIDNHPIDMDTALRDQLDDILEMLAVRIAATRALLHRPSLEVQGASSPA